MPKRQFAKWIPAPVLSGGAALFLALLMAVAGSAQASLHLEVLRGEGSNNNALHGPAISSAVRVLDDGGRPIAGVLVVFSPPSEGASVVFSGFEAEANTLTDDYGVAIAPRARPAAGNGPVEIGVMASHAGEFANCVIHQMNIGVGGDGDRERELDVVRLQSEKQVGSKPNAASGVSVRVEDAKGNPIPLAEVLFVLRNVSRGDNAEEISRTVTTAGQNGEATGTIAKRSGNKNFELMVEVADHGRRATRFFRID